MDDYYRYRDLLNDYDRKHRESTDKRSGKSGITEKDMKSNYKADEPYPNHHHEDQNERTKKDYVEECSEFCDLEEVDHCGGTLTIF